MAALDKQAAAAIASYVSILKLSGSATASVMPMFATIIASSKERVAVYPELADMIALAAASGADFRKLMIAEGVPALLRTMRQASPGAAAQVEKALALLEAGGGDVAALKGGEQHVADFVAASKRPVQTLQITMESLLGVRSEEDRYIRAVLKVDDVTSVTLDKRREVGLVYHASPDAFALKAQIYKVVQAVCDEIMDGKGQRRFTVRGDHAAYLEDEDEGEDFFANGGELTQTEPTRELSADELIRQRDADKKLSIGLLGWAKSWLW